MLEQALLELALLFALCVGVAVSFGRLKLPPIVGFLVAGVVVGPHAIGLVQHEELVRELAEVGIVVLLFAVGLEVPLAQLGRLRRAIVFGGFTQILGTIAVTAVAGWALGLGFGSAIFLGFLMSLSSTAASTKMLVDHGELGAPHGRTVLGIAVAQDLAVVPMIVLIPLLGALAPTLAGDLANVNVDALVGGAMGSEAEAAAAGGESVGVHGEGASHAAPDSPQAVLLNLGLLVALVVAGRLLVKPLVAFVCGARSRELFVLFLATWCLGFAALTAMLGMSLALGAFLAGILLADSDHHSQAATEVEPFRDAFASLFFVSIGMLFDWRTIAAAPWTVGTLVLAVIVGKALIVLGAAWLLGQPFWVRMRAALTLAQVGEFSFVLVQLGRRSELLPASAEALFVVAAVISIAMTPLLYGLGQRLALRARDLARDAAGGDREASTARGDGERGDERNEHAILVGYGPTGRAVAAGLAAAQVPYVVAEMNAATVRAEKARGVPIVLADATRTSVLNSLGIARARLVVLAINDTAATQRIVSLIQAVAPHVHLVARAAYNHEVGTLQRAGAHEIVPQELEASVEVMVRVLRWFLVADDEIGRQVSRVRAEAGVASRASPVPGPAISELAEFVPGIGFVVRLVAAGSAVAGRSLLDCAVWRLTHCSVAAVRRAGVNLDVVTPETVLEVGDTVVLIGPQARLAETGDMFACAAATDGAVDPLAGQRAVEPPAMPRANASECDLSTKQDPQL
ncbi:MAG: cation:proton antiporter [Planctomycetota bacterium]